ncbi:SLC13/DASS family transporter [Pelomyxa schiedti]|nr:SLC13/DASS family transporter [Pelomyxa schiedti]
MGKTPSVKKIVGLVGGPLSLLVCFFLPLDEDKPLAGRCLGVVVWMSLWWITEALPLCVTSLLPLVLFPTLGIMSGAEVSKMYFDPVSTLCLGGSMVAMALDRWGIQQRMALYFISKVGTRPEMIIFVFSGITFFLSMWIQNVTATILMLANSLAFLGQIESILGNIEHDNRSRVEVTALTKALVLSTSWSSSLGGCATLVGTATNLVFVRIYQSFFPEATEITFTQWFLFSFPLCFALNLACWIVLVAYFWFLRGGIRGTSCLRDLSRAIFKERYSNFPKICYEEIVVLVDFCILVLLFLFRSGIKFGWSQIFPEPLYLNDGTSAIFCGGILYLIPARSAYLFSERDRQTVPPPSVDASSTQDSSSSIPLESQNSTGATLCTTTTTTSSTHEIYPLIGDSSMPMSRNPVGFKFTLRKVLCWSDTQLLDETSFHQLPWDILMVLGGGLSLAQGISVSGLGQLVGQVLSGLRTLPVWGLVVISTLVTKILTEFTINLTAATLILPILASIALEIGIEPLIVMVPATLTTSFAFMLPTACGPNIIAFGSRRLRIIEMIIAGGALSLICVVALSCTALIPGWITWAFNPTITSTNSSSSLSHSSSRSQ